MGKYLIGLFSLVIVIACKNSSSNGVPLSTQISMYENKLAEHPSQGVLDTLKDLYVEAIDSATGELKLDFIWKAAETARAAKDFPTAERLFMQLYTDHRDSDWASKALFLHAFMCDEDLSQYDRAKSLYTQFIEQFPNSDFHDDAQFLLDNLGKSDEEMLEILNKASQEQKQN